MARGKGLILLLYVFSLFLKVSSVEKLKRDRAIAKDGNEKRKNETELAEKSRNSTLFPPKMKPNRNAKVNLGNCRLKVKWF